MFNQGNNLLFGGDLNCRHRTWGCQRANAWGTILHDLSITQPFSVLYPSTPTYVPSNSRYSPSTIDIFVTNVSSSNITQPVSVNDLSSDHNPVLCQPLWSGERKTEYVQDIKNANWTRFRSEINAKLRNSPMNLESISNISDVDAALNEFCSNVLSAVENSVPKVPKLPHHILALFRLTNKYRRDWTRYRQPFLKCQLQYLNNLISKQIFEFHNKNWNAKLKMLEKNDKPFWNIVKVIRNRNKFLPVLKSSSNVFFTDSEKANALAQSFSNNHASGLSDQGTRNTVQKVMYQKTTLHFSSTT